MKLQAPMMKVFSLAVFILFIAGFVSYKSKTVNHYSYAANSAELQPGDTSKPVDTIRPRMIMMSSSKSMILVDEQQLPGFIEGKKMKLITKSKAGNATLNDSLVKTWIIPGKQPGAEIKPTPRIIKDTAGKY